MSEDVTPAAPRSGSQADLSQRMDRMEKRQDGLDARISELATTVARVELNQTHAIEVNKLRFDSLDNGNKSILAGLTEFGKRIEGIMTGEIKTAAARELEAAKAEADRASAPIMADYLAWRKEVDAFMDDQRVRAGRGEGVWVALGGIKGALIMGAALASPVITVIALIVKH